MLYGQVYGALPPQQFRPIEEVPIYAFYGDISPDVDVNCLRVLNPYELLFTGEKGYFSFALYMGKYTIFAYVADKLVLLGRVTVTPGIAIRII